ncbi:MAG: 50S ribosomal protein L18 [Proteobacteria bacterium]|nr:50S ribosomal protein L18 [Pseudomonadota bacterium]
MDKLEKRIRRKKSIRKRVSGTAERPRMTIHKSNKGLYVQVIDDVQNRTICGISTHAKAVRENVKDTCSRKNVRCAEVLGEHVARLALEKGVKKVVFDRAGYMYHGVVKTLADSARKNGLEF